MKKMGALCFKFMQMAAVVIALLLLPLPAVAHDVDIDASGVTENSVGNVHDSDRLSHEFGCLSSGTEQGVHCHLACTRSQAAGPGRLLDDDSPVAAVHHALPPLRQADTRSVILSAHIPITVFPRFILFSNFRS